MKEEKRKKRKMEERKHPDLSRKKEASERRDGVLEWPSGWKTRRESWLECKRSSSCSAVKQFFVKFLGL